MDNLTHSKQIHNQYIKEHNATDAYPQQVELKDLNVVDIHDFHIPRLMLAGFPTYGTSMMTKGAIHARTGRSVKKHHVENWNGCCRKETETGTAMITISTRH
jgi:hypothetical protein